MDALGEELGDGLQVADDRVHHGEEEDGGDVERFLVELIRGRGHSALTVEDGAADERDDEVLGYLGTDEVELAGLGEPGTCEEDPALRGEGGGEGGGMGVTEEGGTGRGG